MVGIDSEIARVNVVAFEHHFKNFWLVHRALLHETYHFVLLSDGLFHIVIKLNLDFILNLTCLREEVLVLWRICEVFTIFSQQVELADVRPGVESVAHWVHGPNADVLAAPQQVHLVDFAIEILPVEGQWDPGQAVGGPEQRQGELPIPHQGIDEENVPGQWHAEHLCAIRVLQVDRTVLNIVAAPKQQFALTIELERLRWLVNFVCSLEILSGTACELLLRGVNDFVKIVHLSE